MTINNTSATTMSGRPIRGHAGRNIVAAAIAAGAVVAASVGLWTYTQDEETTFPPAPSFRAVTSDGPSVPFARTGGQSLPYTIFVVSSDERAAQVRAGQEDANVIRAAQNLAPMGYEIVVATDEDGDAIMASEASLDSILAASGQPPVRFADLRGQ